MRLCDTSLHRSRSGLNPQSDRDYRFRPPSATHISRHSYLFSYSLSHFAAVCSSLENIREQTMCSCLLFTYSVWTFQLEIIFENARNDEAFRWEDDWTVCKRCQCSQQEEHPPLPIWPFESVGRKKDGTGRDTLGQKPKWKNCCCSSSLPPKRSISSAASLIHYSALL